jgi:hypothetical protein
MSQITARIDDIDLQVHRIRGLFLEASKKDKELAAGLGTTHSFSSIQKAIDLACASVEEFYDHVKKTHK